jgi:hypothetical protein
MTILTLTGEPVDGAPRRAASLPSPFLSYGPTFRREFPPLDHLDLDLPSSRSPSPTRIFSRSTPLRPIHLPSSLPRCLLPPRHTRQLSSPPNTLKSCSSRVLVPSRVVSFHSVPDTTHDSSILRSSARPPEPRNFNTASPQPLSLPSFYPLWNRWNTLPPYPLLLSLTCQVDMSSSRAPPGVSITHPLFPFLSRSMVCQIVLIYSRAHISWNGLHCPSQLRHRRRLCDLTCPSWCCALPRPS